MRTPEINAALERTISRDRLSKYLATNSGDMIRRFRNRVAHHEPILSGDLPARHREIIETIGWMCPLTASWSE
jgi:hypothetical protein